MHLILIQTISVSPSVELLIIFPCRPTPCQMYVDIYIMDVSVLGGGGTGTQGWESVFHVTYIWMIWLNLSCMCSIFIYRHCTPYEQKEIVHKVGCLCEFTVHAMHSLDLVFVSQHCSLSCRSGKFISLLFVWDKEKGTAGFFPLPDVAAAGGKHSSSTAVFGLAAAGGGWPA